MYEEHSVLKRHKLILQDFWHKYGGTGARYEQAILPKTRVIDELVAVGQVNLNYRSPTHTRADWDKRKFKVKKFQKFTYCFACGGRPQARHHIIWLSHGGRNQKNNIIALCNPCHAEIHPWLR